MHRIVHEKAATFEDVHSSVLDCLLESVGCRTIRVNDLYCDKVLNDHQYCLTFDDGNESNWTETVRLLNKFSFRATFFVVTSWIGTAGFLSKEQIVELASAGMEIGSHTHTHPRLSVIDNASVLSELVESKRRLEDIIGDSVSSLAFPYGMWNRSTAEAAFGIGYERCCTSRHGLATNSSVIVPRNSINALTSRRGLDRLLKATPLTKLQWILEDLVKERIKALIPDQYTRLRRMISRGLC